MSQSPLLTFPSFLMKSLVTQALSLAVCVITWPILGSLAFILILASLTALLAASFIGLPTPWIILNCALPVAASTTLSLNLPSAVYLVPLLCIAAIYAPAIITRVPFYPTQLAAYEAILSKLPSDRHFKFIDVGCGFGDLLFFLAKRRSNGEFYGIELGPLPFLVAKLRSFLPHQGQTKILYRDMWRFPLNNFDFIYTFLSPAVMEQIRDKLAREISASAVFISNSFPLPVAADEEIALDDNRQAKLFIYRKLR